MIFVGKENFLKKELALPSLFARSYVFEIYGAV